MQILRRRDFRFPRGHGRTYVRVMDGPAPTRRCRHLSVWFGQSPEDVDLYNKPRFTLSIDLYRECP